MRSIFEYNDYRKYIADYYAEKKRTTGYFTYRYFAQIAGFSSPVFIKLVIDGKSNLRTQSTEKLCRAMELQKSEAEYFAELVKFQQAKNPENKRDALESLRSLNQEFGVQVLDTDQYDYYENWYNSVLREIAPNVDSGLSEKELGELVYPPIGARDAKKSLKMLKEKELLSQDDDGNYIQSKRLLSTGTEFESLAVRAHHSKMAKLASESVENIAKEERDISGMTMGVSEEVYNKLREEIRLFRQKVMKIVSEDEQVDRVYRLNFQLFPLSEKLNKKAGEK